MSAAGYNHEGVSGSLVPVLLWSLVLRYQRMLPSCSRLTSADRIHWLSGSCFQRCLVLALAQVSPFIILTRPFWCRKREVWTSGLCGGCVDSGWPTKNTCRDYTLVRCSKHWRWITLIILLQSGFSRCNIYEAAMEWSVLCVMQAGKV